MIGSVGSYSAAQTRGTSGLNAASATGQVSEASENQGASGSQGGGTLTISTLASQLAASASRAEERDKTLTRSELADKAKSILNHIVGDSYYAKNPFMTTRFPIPVIQNCCLEPSRQRHSLMMHLEAVIR